MTGIETAVLANWLMGAAVAGSAESIRKGHVAGKIAKKEQKAATDKAEKKAKAQEDKNLAIRQAEAMSAKKKQTETVVRSPFAGKKKKGSMRSQFTVGGGGSGSGTNY